MSWLDAYANNNPIDPMQLINAYSTDLGLGNTGMLGSQILQKYNILGGNGSANNTNLVNANFPSLFGIQGLGGGDLVQAGAGLFGMYMGNKLAKKELQQKKDAINANIYNQNLVASKDLDRMKALASASTGGNISNAKLYDHYKPKYI